MGKQQPPRYPEVPIERLWDKGHRHERIRQKNDGTWRVQELRQVVANEPVFDVPLAFLPLRDHEFDMGRGLVSFAQHMKHVLDADLSYPIIFDEFGCILDGRHRIVKALLEGRTTIKGVRVPPGTAPTTIE